MARSERIYVRVSLEEKQQLEKIAKEEGRTLSGLIRYITQQYMNTKKEGN